MADIGVHIAVIQANQSHTRVIMISVMVCMIAWATSHEDIGVEIKIALI